MSDEKIKISDEALRFLKHMLGANSQYNKKNWGFRNYFAAGSAQIETMEELVSAGLAVNGGKRGDLTFYFANEKGCKFAGLDEKATQRALND